MSSVPYGDFVLPPGALVIGDPDGEERRYAAPRARKLDPEQEHNVRVAASRGSSLRDLAAHSGVSHQTISSIVRGDTAPGAAPGAGSNAPAAVAAE